MGFLNQVSYRLERPPLCARCKMRIDTDEYCAVCGFSTTGQELYQFVRINRLLNVYTIDCAFRDVDEARQALKELKLAKRGIAGCKRQVMEAKRQIRARFTDSIRRPSFIAEKFFWVSDKSRRSVMASDLAPYEKEQKVIENLRMLVEQKILHVESLLLRS